MLVRIGVLLFAYLLDWCVGEPHNPLHPVCLMARLASWLERLTRSLFPNQLRFAGLLTWLVTVAATLAVSLGILWIASFHWLSQLLVGGAMGYFCIAPKGLGQEADKVVAKLKAGDLPGARKQLSMIVGRDTAELTESEILRAVIETVAENFSDGVVAPMLFMGLLGPAFGMAYKAINTMDSLFGYRNEIYGEFGFFPARLDDFFNLVPARLSALLVILSSFLCGLNGICAARVWWSDRYHHLSPNSAHPEAAFAGALGISMGGGHYYGGVWVEKPIIGKETRPVGFERVKESKRLLYLATFFCVCLSMALCLFGLW